MALTLPDPEELDEFSHGATDSFDDSQKFTALQQAADLLYLATGVETDPENPTVLRILGWGLMDMAFKILITRENQTEIYSPYTSETIGSYSYSKSRVMAGEVTGVEWFDAIVKLLMGAMGAGAVWSATEHVFEQPYCEDPPYSWIVPDVYGR